MKKNLLISLLLSSFMLVGCGEEDKTSGSSNASNNTNTSDSTSALSSSSILDGSYVKGKNFILSSTYTSDGSEVEAYYESIFLDSKISFAEDNTYVWNLYHAPEDAEEFPITYYGNYEENDDIVSIYVSSWDTVTDETVTLEEPFLFCDAEIKTDGLHVLLGGYGQSVETMVYVYGIYNEINE